jgi:hypothetical protein
MTTETTRVERRRLALGWHWLWFIPLCVVVFFFVERHTVTWAFGALRLAWERWFWGTMISPSAVFCFSVIFASVVWPIYGLASVAYLVAAKQQWPWILLIIGAIVLLPLLTDFLIWGSFPLPTDQQGFIHLRMIPFIPWPGGDFGEVG